MFRLKFPELRILNIQVILMVKSLQSIVIDTGPLFIVLCQNYLELSENKSINRDRILNIAYDKISVYPELGNALRNFINRIHNIFTTSHVLGEINRHVNRLDLDLRKSKIFWDCTIKFLIEKNFGEELISSLDINKNGILAKLVLDIGLVDTGLIQLAQKINAPILTDDRRTLYKRARQNSVNGYHLIDDIYYSYTSKN